MIVKTFLTLILGAALLTAWPDVGSAHAFLAKAEPAVGATVTVPPKTVRIWFTSKVESAFSVIEVTDVQGRRVDQNDTQASDKSDQVLQVDLSGGLAPGRYRVVWRVIAIDGHKTFGDFYFIVK